MCALKPGLVAPLHEADQALLHDAVKTTAEYVVKLVTLVTAVTCILPPAATFPRARTCFSFDLATLAANLMFLYAPVFGRLFG